MGCGICNPTTISLLPSPTPSLFVTSGINPLGGGILQPGQIVVTGSPSTMCTQPDGTTGPRRTVVWVQKPETWPVWIVASSSGAPVDNGAAGGCYQPQQLPDLVATAKKSWPWLLLLALALLWLWSESKRT